MNQSQSQQTNSKSELNKHAKLFTIEYNALEINYASTSSCMHPWKNSGTTLILSKNEMCNKKNRKIKFSRYPV